MYREEQEPVEVESHRNDGKRYFSWMCYWHLYTKCDTLFNSKWCLDALDFAEEIDHYSEEYMMDFFYMYCGTSQQFT